MYQRPELIEREWYYSVKMDRYIAALIDTVNRGDTIFELTKPGNRIRQMVELYKKQS